MNIGQHTKRDQNAAHTNVPTGMDKFRQLTWLMLNVMWLCPWQL